MHGQIRLILFDLDDTLLHFDDYWEASSKEAFRHHPLTCEEDPDQLFACFRQKSEVYERQYYHQQISIQQFREKRFIETLAEFGKQADELSAKAFEKIYQQQSKAFMKADERLIELLSTLQARYLLGIVTNGTASWQQDKLQALGVNRFFPAESVFISEQVGCEKPSPEIYYRPLRHFRVEPNEALFVGDSWKNDVEGPMRIGMKSIWFNKKGRTQPASPVPVGTIKQISELKAFV
ncbi:haloacid dehalogenase [Paenibacillus sp. J2TS4]|nr:haloacid dehalogenase [Paenibacillus sp. J2TS4]